MGKRPTHVWTKHHRLVRFRQILSGLFCVFAATQETSQLLNPDSSNCASGTFHNVQEVSLEFLSPRSGSAYEETTSDCIVMRIRASMGCGWLKLERLANNLILQQGDIHIGGQLVVQRNGINFLEDGGEISMVESDDGGIDIKYPTQWRPGIHTISALVVAWSPSISADVHDTMLGNEIAVHIMVADALSDEIPEEFRCDMLLSVDHLGISPVDSGSLYNAWHQQQRCLRIFTDMFPSC